MARGGLALLEREAGERRIELREPRRGAPAERSTVGAGPLHLALQFKHLLLELQRVELEAARLILLLVEQGWRDQPARRDRGEHAHPVIGD